MSVPYSQIPSTLILDPTVTASALRVWHVIYTETLGRPGWDLTYSQIGRKIGSDRRTAMRGVELLVDKGWLVKTQRQTTEGDDAPNLYAVCREPFLPWNEGGGDTDARGGDRNVTRGGDTDVTHQKNHLPGEQPLDDGWTPPPSVHQFSLLPTKAKPATVEEEFDRWWKVVPKKVAKGQALRSFRAAVKKVPVDTLIAATEAGTGWNLDRPKQFQKHPSTWLVGECWLDEETTQRVAEDRWEDSPWAQRDHTDYKAEYEKLCANDTPLEGDPHD